jgi:hypothetical protein
MTINRNYEGEQDETRSSLNRKAFTFSNHYKRPFLSVVSLIHNVDGSTNGWTDQLMDRRMDGHILIDFK